MAPRQVQLQLTTWLLPGTKDRSVQIIRGKRRLGGVGRTSIPCSFQSDHPHFTGGMVGPVSNNPFIHHEDFICPPL